MNLTFLSPVHMMVILVVALILFSYRLPPPWDRFRDD